ncbi:hypothetical protein [Mesorhizobium xinjiangense]|uniref:hypothetical protein n=1 Tax=Mesorhizobium xinjiangense TaxID=2678685 RepID=UPI0018DBDD54|nr:hypothetical protein [Mesorhizobium xinjiangense]
MSQPAEEQQPNKYSDNSGKDRGLGKANGRHGQPPEKNCDPYLTTTTGRVNARLRIRKAKNVRAPLNCGLVLPHRIKQFHERGMEFYLVRGDESYCAISFYCTANSENELAMLVNRTGFGDLVSGGPAA